MTESVDTQNRLSGQDIITWAQAQDMQANILEQADLELKSESVIKAIVTAVSAQRVEHVREVLGSFLAQTLYETGVSSLRTQIKERDLSTIYSQATGLAAPPLAHTLVY